VVSSPWKLPPPSVRAVLEAAPTPWVLLSPDTRTLLFLEHEALPDLADVARAKLKLAGLRIDPATNAHHQVAFGTGLVVRERDGQRERRVALPPERRISGVRFASDSRRAAFTLAAPDRTELWTLELASLQFTLRVERLNALFGDGFEWLGDGERLLALRVPAGRGAPPAPGLVPAGPAVQDARGEVTPLRTYQDLLASPHDEALFEHYATAELVLCTLADGSLRPLAAPAIHSALDPAPDGRHVLLTRVERPWSYLHPVHGFPYRASVLDLADGSERLVAEVPLAENIPIEGVRQGARAWRWNPLCAARLTWVEALDGGDPRRSVPHRDRWMEQDFDRPDEARELVRVEQRASALHWFEDGERFLARDYDRDRRWTRLGLWARGQAAPLALLDDRSIKDRYGDPGGILLRALSGGRRVVREEDGCVLRTSDGESRSGARPFLDRQELASAQRTRLFECAAGEFESFQAVVEEDGRVVALLTRHESPDSPPNLRLRNLGRAGWSAVTRFADPTPELRSITKELVHYRRADGVELSGQLHLPPGWQGERLPLVIWAYPRDYVDPETAGQVLDTPHTFTRIGGPSQLCFALQGYAVLDGASMPIVGPAESMNDSFVEQAVASARAAIEHLTERGVCDPERVGIGGHSYGAFMTAVLLAHSTLFRAGIARSGAYNRTLTPFGFQSERRTLWEARASYLALSPLLEADRIRTPLLLIHGAEDANPGTHPLQSERLFQAIKGTGGLARHVVLPHEGHSYRARQSVLHVVAEMLEWFERYVRTPS